MLSFLLRDYWRYRSEPTRWLSMVAQPLIFWWVLASGLKGDSSLYFSGNLVFCLLLASMISGMSLIEDKNSGMIRGILVSPIPKSSLLGGKLIGIGLITVIQGLLYGIIGYLNHIDIPWAPYSLLCFYYGLTLGALNLAIAWISPSNHAYHGVISLLWFPLWIISGSLFPVVNTPFEWISYLNPLSYSLESFRDLLKDPSVFMISWQSIVFLILGIAISYTVISKRPPA